MKRKNLALTGAAAFAAASLLVAPAMAQTATSPTQYGSSSQYTSPSMSTQNTASGEALSAVSNPKQKLSSATVQDSTGQTIGQVQKVKTSASGTPTAIEVNLTSAHAPKTVELKASQVRYNSLDNMLKTISLTASQVDAMPAVSNP